MGAFTDDGGEAINREEETKQELELDAEGNEIEVEPIGYDTDVAGVKSDGIVQQGFDKYPVFNVDRDEFYQNMSNGRNNLQFKTGTTAQQYITKTASNSTFFVQYTDTDGETYSRKIK